jgi:hypothetical protein
MMRLLEGPVGTHAEVSAVPFPGSAFDRAIDRQAPDVVVVDVTYLMEEKVRPLLMQRLAETRITLVFVSEGGSVWVDDLATRRSGPADASATRTILDLVERPALRLVQVP